MFYLKHVHPSHSSGEYVLVQTIQVSTPFFRWNQLRIDLVLCYMLHVTCYMWSVMCCMWLVTCKSFIIYWETGDQELCSWFFSWEPALWTLISLDMVMLRRSKKCLKVRQALGTWKVWKLDNFENLTTWKLWKHENFENFKTLKMILRACWTFVFMSMIKSRCL